METLCTARTREMTAGISWGSRKAGQPSISPLPHEEALGGWGHVLNPSQPLASRWSPCSISQGRPRAPQPHCVSSRSP